MLKISQLIGTWHYARRNAALRFFEDGRVLMIWPDSEARGSWELLDTSHLLLKFWIPYQIPNKDWELVEEGMYLTLQEFTPKQIVAKRSYEDEPHTFARASE